MKNYYTAAELAERGRQPVPDLYNTGKNLIYSSPAALAFNSPGAEGFGVKRAGLSIPGSVMLIVSPGCCGRNTSQITKLEGYEDRFFYLVMNETDLVTGRHLKKIPEAVREIVRTLPEKPSLVMLCITCVDALLGTDMDRVSRAAEKAAGVPVRPCYMYALTREGRKPPMVQVRTSLYSVLRPQRRSAAAVNLLGYFAPLRDDFELYDMLKEIGVREIREISRCRDMQEFQAMARANFNLVLNPEAAPAAQALSDRLGIPYIELNRFYEMDAVRRQYLALGKVLGTDMEKPGGAMEQAKQAARAAIDALQSAHPSMTFSIGEVSNANPFELALALVRCGWNVSEIFGIPAPAHFPYIRRLAALSPQTRIYSNMEPTMMNFTGDLAADITIGKDAAWYHPQAAHVFWNEDVQPYGFAGIRDLMQAIGNALDGTAADKITDEKSPAPAISGQQKANSEPAQIKGFRRYLTPFAPDISGAESVLYPLGGMIVIIDAGGCTGNVCGFDEPRWGRMTSGQAGSAAVFSAGLRDMDAIMGRDRLLVQKISEAADRLDVRFIALIGSPVPSVIGTDYLALKRMLEKKVSLPVLTIPANGMRLYPDGAADAYLALFKAFGNADAKPSEDGPVLGVLGTSPMELPGPGQAEALRRWYLQKGYRRVILYGWDASPEDYASAAANTENIAVSVTGLKAARYLQETYGTAFKADFPIADRLLPDNIVCTGQKILVAADQIAGNALRNVLLHRGASGVTLASFFDMDPALRQDGDVQFNEEYEAIRFFAENSFDLIIGDSILQKLLPAGFTGRFLEVTQFPLSGKLSASELKS